MTSSYLICDLCGQPGPPAAYFFKDGVRMCYGCFLKESENLSDAPAPDDAQEPESDRDEGTPKPGQLDATHDGEVGR